MVCMICVRNYDPIVHIDDRQGYECSKHIVADSHQDSKHNLRIPSLVVAIMKTVQCLQVFTKGPTFKVSIYC